MLTANGIIKNKKFIKNRKSSRKFNTFSFSRRYNIKL